MSHVSHAHAGLFGTAVGTLSTLLPDAISLGWKVAAAIPVAIASGLFYSLAAKWGTERVYPFVVVVWDRLSSPAPPPLPPPRARVESSPGHTARRHTNLPPKDHE